MKSTGIVRKVDQLGRVVLPKELRDTMDIQEGTPLEIFTEGDLIIFRKYQPGCVFCSAIGVPLVSWKNKTVCTSCILGLRHSEIDAALEEMD